MEVDATQHGIFMVNLGRLNQFGLNPLSIIILLLQGLLIKLYIICKTSVSLRKLYKSEMYFNLYNYCIIENIIFYLEQDRQVTTK